MNFFKNLMPLILIMQSIQADKMEDITKNIKSVCASPDQKSKYWEVKADGKTKVKIKLLGMDNTLNGSISTGEWEGIQTVLKKQQANENKNYRECVRELTPIFIANFKQTTPTTIKKPLLLKENKFSIDLKVYEEGDLADELGHDLVIKNKNKKNVISGLQSKPTGYLEVNGLNLTKKFIVYIVNDMNTDKIEYILRTRDDDIDNDIKILIDGGYIIFGDTKKSFSNKEETNYIGGIAINEFKLYMKKNVMKFYINDKYFGSIKANNNIIYDKFIIKNLEPKDYIYEVSGYNIKN